MEPDGDSPPFWTQSPTFFHRQRRRQPPSSPLINPVAVIFLVPILVLLVLFFLLPPFFSHASQFLRPNSVKKSWDSINVLLVVFAILCGVFARKNDDVSGPRNEDVAREDKGNVGSDFEYSDPKVYSSNPVAVTGTGISRLRRSSSSYPDLRQVSAWEMEDNRFRFYDDFEVNFYRSTAAEYDRHRPRWSKEDPVKVIPVDTVKVRSSPPETSSPVPNPPPPPPPSQKKLKRRRSLNSVPRTEILDMQKDETAAVFVENIPPPPPPPPAVREQFPAEKPRKLQRKKSGARNEIATAIASFYNQKKRKQRSKPRNIYETAPTAEHSSVPPQTPPPPPPPPPPPSKVFHNLFKKSGKSKRVHSVSYNAPPLPLPPPPPPPPKSILNNLFKTSGKSNLSNYSKFGHSFLKTGNISRRFNFKSPNYASAPSPPSYYHQTSNQSPSTTRKPPLPAENPSGYYDENLNSGTQSPLIPAPPPPLPFRMPEMSFVPRGDFVRILSNHSSRCSSPELEDVDVMSVKSEQIDGEDVIGPSVCPSPDVNVKAETFIAGLRDKWRMEKINSLRTKGKLG